MKIDKFLAILSKADHNNTKFEYCRNRDYGIVRFPLSSEDPRVVHTNLSTESDMIYCGTIVNQKTDGIIKYRTCSFCVSTDDSTVEYPTVVACHGDRCRVFNIEDKYLCESCYQLDERDWPKKESLDTNDVKEIQQFVHSVEILETITSNQKTDFKYIKSIKDEADILDDTIRDLSIKKDKLLQKWKELTAK